MRSRGHSRVKRIALFFLKGIYLAPIFAFGIWLINIVYFQGHEFNPPVSSESEKKDVGGFNILMPKQEALPRDHFHMIDQYVAPQRDNQPVCVICHGSYAHVKEKKVRAILNMHDGYIACAVCHARQDAIHGKGQGVGAGKGMEFLWVDRETGEYKHAVKGEYGKYPAKIFPIAYSAQGAGRIFTPITVAAAREFLDRLPGLTPEQAKKARAALHDPLSKEAVSCADCHKKEGYLDFQALGFPQQRIDHLISTEFVGMIEKDKTFHLPSVIDFGGR